MDVLFLRRCLNKLGQLSKERIEKPLFGELEDSDVIDYLVSNKLAELHGDAYFISNDGENWLKGKRFEEQIAATEKEDRLLNASEQSASAAKESAQSAKDANVIANKSLEKSDESIALSKEANIIASRSNTKATVSNWIAGGAACISLLTLIYYILTHYKIF